MGLGYAPLFWAFVSAWNSFRLDGSANLPPRLALTVGRVALELIYSYIRLMYDDFVPFITNRLIV
jgi:hypothetical protein